MSKPSSWPLPPNSCRFVVPKPLVEQQRRDLLTRDLYLFGAGHYVEAKGHHMKRAVHDDFLLIYCTAGLGHLTLAKPSTRKLQIQTGDLVILPRGLAHEYVADKRTPWSIYWVHFEGPLGKRFIENIRLDYNYPIINIGQQAKLVSDFENLLQIRQTGYQLKPFIHAANQLRQILSYVALLRPQEATRKSQSGQFDLERIHSMMQERIHEQLDLETLAASCNLSKYHFAKKYKELTGSSAINHFINLKIEHACQLLDVSQKSISQISYDVGYDDAYYFSRIFKKVMGLSPSEYRKMRLGSWPRTAT
ncbi:MAG: AraC family transcriptional regulator [Motiliproteus sp.]|nr:AraC family transcriptional regulator [Motiliproteus sp.]MCW9051581.1 AraC family transcriptional regulator [Motiliproteus sp.]